MPESQCEITGDEPSTSREKLELLEQYARHLSGLEREEAARLIAANGHAWHCKGQGWPRRQARTLEEWDAIVG